MLNASDLHSYQQKAVNHQCSHPASALWLDPGLGKTAVTLTSITHLLNVGYMKAVVIIAPIRVCRLVWRQEAAKWSHTKHLRFSMVIGSKDQRTRALMKQADVYLMNYENLEWLSETLRTYYIDKNRLPPFDGIVYDECFVSGTRIKSGNLEIAIDNIKVGDIVTTHLGEKRVTRVMRKSASTIVQVTFSNGSVIRCTPDHPIFTTHGWIKAGDLQKGDIAHEASHNSTVWARIVRNLRDGVLETASRTIHLFKTVCKCLEDATTGDQESRDYWRHPSIGRSSKKIRGVEQRTTLGPDNHREDEKFTTKSRLFTSDWWQRYWRIMGRKTIKEGVAGSVRSGIHFQNAVPTGWIPYTLQTRFWRPYQQNRNRSPRTISHGEIGETKGLEKTRILGKVWVEDVVHHQCGSGVDVWNISTEEAETYFAEGVLVHNCSKLKNSTTDRVKALMKVLPHLKWRTGLTGTPASNGYKDLHGQFLVLDGGQRLGVGKTQFTNRFYRKVGPHKDVIVPGSEDVIKMLISDITLEMSAADYNPLPDMIINDVEVELDEGLRAKYDQMEREFFTQLDNGTDVEVFNQASLTNKLLQFSNGAVYPVPGMPQWEPVHDAKLDALEDIIEENGGKPILCSYAYRSDAARIMERFKKLRPINLTECKSEAALQNAMSRWLAGDCQLMIGHSASIGHGLDGLQKRGSTLVWFGLTWSLDLYEQFNARLRRQGQGVPVVCHRIVTIDTMDQAQALALNDKATSQNALRDAVKKYRAKKFLTE